MKKTVVIGIMALGLATLASHARGAFQDMNWSVRSSGMGGAFVAIADDADSPLVNPAGMMQVEGGQADFMYSKLFTGLDDVDLGLQYASFVHELRSGSIGLTWTRFETKDVYLENTITLAYALDLDKVYKPFSGIFAGAALKYLSHTYLLDQYTAGDPLFADTAGKAALTGDIGFLGYPLHDELPGFSVGAAVRNITQPDVGIGSVDKVPMETEVGAALTTDSLKVFNKFEMIDPVVSVDVRYRMQDWGDRRNKVTVAVGGECWLLRKTLGLRVGADSAEITGGVSVNCGITKSFGVRFDYAVNFPIYMQGTTGSHKGSLLIKF